MKCSHGIAMSPERQARIAATTRTGKNRRKGKGHAATADLHFTDEQAEFLKAIDAFKRATGRQFPTAADILAIARGLGYRKRA
jgi:hypothetical protein